MSTSTRRSFNNFTGGEWSPFLDARADLEKYPNALRTFENMRPMPHGGACRRPGTLYAGTAKYSDRPCRLIPFNYSTTVEYMIEMGDKYFRFWNSDGTQVMQTTASLWVSGQTYGSGNFVMSPADGKVYYNIMAFGTAIVNDTTDPSLDPTNWVQQTIYESPSPYAYTDIFQVQFKEVNAAVFMVHPNYAPLNLFYFGANVWTSTYITWKYPALQDQNVDQSITLQVAATTGTTTLTASKALFNPLHVGSYWELQQLRKASSVELDMNNQSIGVQVFSSTLQTQGSWTFTTSQFWYGTVQVQRSDDGGTTWKVIREFTSGSDQNYSTSGTEQAPDIGFPATLLRIAYTMTGSPFSSAVWVGATPTQYAYAKASLVSQDAYISGIVKVTAYTSSTQVTVSTIISPQDTTATYLWSEGAWSDYRGYPRAVGIYEQRLLYGGTAHQPNTLWGSVTSDFSNFQYSANDDGAVAFQFADAEQNPINFLSTLLRIHAGTTGEEFLVASGNQDEPLTPSNITVRRQSTYGTSAIMPILVHNSILFVERNGQRLREMRELSPYVVPTDFIAPDLTILAEHLFRTSPIVEMDYGSLPDPLIYVIRADGQLPVMTYNKEQNIMAWARYRTGADSSDCFESVSALYGSPADTVWVAVKRTINGSTVRYLEIFTTDPGLAPDKTNNVMVDCAYAHTYGSPTTAITGLTWLKNRLVDVVADGNALTPMTVDSSGNLTLTTAATVVRVGIHYDSTMELTKPEMPDQKGVSQGRYRAISSVAIRFKDTLNAQISGDGVNWQTVRFRETSDLVLSSPPLYSGDKQMDNWPSGDDYDSGGWIRQNLPLPLTILGVFVSINYLG